MAEQKNLVCKYNDFGKLSYKKDDQMIKVFNEKEGPMFEIEYSELENYCIIFRYGHEKHAFHFNCRKTCKDEKNDAIFAPRMLFRYLIVTNNYVDLICEKCQYCTTVLMMIDPN